MLQPPSAHLGLCSGIGAQGRAVSPGFWGCLCQHVAWFQCKRKAGDALPVQGTFVPGARLPGQPDKLSRYPPTPCLMLKEWHFSATQRKRNETSETPQQIDLALSASNLFTRETAVSRFANQLLAPAGGFCCPAVPEVLSPAFPDTQTSCAAGAPFWLQTERTPTLWFCM